MKSLRATLAISIAALASGALAQSPEGRTRVVRVGSTQPASTQAAQAPAAVYSTEVPLVQRSAPADGGQGTTLVLNAAHSFNVTLSARDPRTGNTGPGVALTQTDVFGYFSIPALTQNPSNPEVFIKILDATALSPPAYWIFYGFLTDLQFDLTVRENATGRTKTFHKDAGQALNGFDTTTFTAGSVTTRETEAIAATPNAFVRTAVDIANHTQASITADVQYTYKCTAAACSPANEFNSSAVKRFNLGPFANLHFDDVVQALADQGALTNPGVVQGSFGTLLVTFNGLPGNVGWEATAQARTYNRLSEPDPLRGTVGYGMNGSLFFESSRTSITGTVRDTHVTPGLEGSLVSQVGIRNTDITGTNARVNVDVSLYDPDSGTRVGGIIALSNISPGEVRLISDIFTEAGVAGLNKTLILFADARNPGTNTPTIEGFVLYQDTNSSDIRFTEMRCANVGGC